jgi:uncharacterized phage-associated protein
MAIANEFLKLSGPEGGLTQMQLQKLVFIANGWNLAINGEPLVAEDAEAWDNGPVYRELWDHLTRFGSSRIGGSIDPSDRGALFGRKPSKEPYKADLSNSERDVIRHVWARYGKKGAFTLSGMTHQPGTPWYKAYFDRGRNSRIDQDEIRKHYTKLAKAARV